MRQNLILTLMENTCFQFNINLCLLDVSFPASIKIIFAGQ